MALALKRAKSGLVSQEQCAVTLTRADSGMVKFRRSKSLFLREGGLLLFFQGLQERLPWLAQGETIVLVHVIRVELNLCCFSYAFHASKSHDQNTGVLKLDVVTQVYA
jgi:hypothetical protein